MQNLFALFQSVLASWGIGAAVYHVDVKDIAAINTVYTVTTVKTDAEIAQAATAWAKIATYLKAHQIVPLSHPYVQFLKYEPGTEITFEAGFAVSAPFKSDADILGGTISAGTFAVTTCSSWADLLTAHTKVREWIQKNGKTQIGLGTNWYMDNIKIMVMFRIK